ncbi:uncharacterized protein EV154DRAFT_282259 [Mucor mucedo]|uniref:uncharacterized protein n=1 Tax=Mucor mucedo TaxID=29922 RepID=UPI00221FC70B|nr:uncharacterized protein EV154DRAFT_282259 [Mucor mucedo]KAI7896164.1 hypothetical protein EV154DRAFT_282259 [Mucor mucedo]
MPHLYDEDPRSTILIIPDLIVKPQRSTGVYLAGILFSLGWWIFLDAYIISIKSPEPLTLVDWMPGIASSLGLLIINFIGRAYFQGEEHVESVWKMRTSLLTGFTLITGGFAGSLCVPVFNKIYYSGIIQNCLILASVIIFWIMQNTL